jgi:hypothetical protein
MTSNEDQVVIIRNIDPELVEYVTDACKRGVPVHVLGRPYIVLSYIGVRVYSAPDQPEHKGIRITLKDFC